MSTLDQLLATAQAAATKAAAAQDAADAARAEAEIRRAERLAAHDREVVASYDRKQLAQDTDAAERRLTEAVLADPIWAAAIQVGVSRRRQLDRWREAGSIGQPPLGSVEAQSFESLARLADKAAHDLAEDEVDQRAQARTSAGDAV